MWACARQQVYTGHHAASSLGRGGIWPAVLMLFMTAMPSWLRRFLPLGAQDENWRMCYKALLLLEHLLKHGPGKIVGDVQVGGQ